MLVSGKQDSLLSRLSEDSRFLCVGAVLIWFCVLKALLLEHCTNMGYRRCLCFTKEIILHDEKHHLFFLRRCNDKDLALH